MKNFRSLTKRIVFLLFSFIFLSGANFNTLAQSSKQVGTTGISMQEQQIDHKRRDDFHRRDNHKKDDYRRNDKKIKPIVIYPMAEDHFNIFLSKIKKVSFKDVAEEHNISVTQCIRIFDESNKIERLPFTRAICVDEFFFGYDHKGDAQYPFIIVDPDSAKIIDILPYRTKPYLESYFRCIPKEERTVVNFFVSDMNETYRTIKKKFFSQALHIVDHFHIIKIFNEKLKYQRLEIMKSYEKDSYEYKFLKKYHKMFYKNTAELKQMRKIDEKTGEIFDWELELKYVLRHYPQLQEIYFAREDFTYSMMKLEDRYKTFNKMDFYIQKFEKSTNKYVREIASTFKNWRFEIVNAYSKNDYHFCLTNAIAENMNGEVKKLINISYGYNKFERLRKRILQSRSLIKLILQSSMMKREPST